MKTKIVITLFILIINFLCGCTTNSYSVNESLPEPTAEPTPYIDPEEEIKHRRDYFINNLIISYNNIAEYPFDEAYVEHIEEVGRPLGSLTYTFANNVFVIIRNNDYSNVLYIDYQDESPDSSALYDIFRDFSLALDTNLSEQDLQLAWDELLTGKYAKYYDEHYFLNKQDICFSSNILLDNTIRYYIKTSYPID